MKVATILKLVSSELQDLEPCQEKRWPWVDETGACGEGQRVSLLDFFNSAVLEIVARRPDLTAITESVLLEPGMRQRLPEKRDCRATNDAMSLIEIIRNMGSDGQTPGASVQLVNADILMAWANAEKCGTAIENYAYDRSTDPTRYLVYPAVPDCREVWVEATYCARPKVVKDPGESLPISEKYAGAIEHHMLAAIMSGDNDAANMQKAAYHAQIYESLLGIGTRTDALWPKAKSSQTPGATL